MTIESIEEVAAAVRRAENEIYRAEKCVGQMAALCVGRLRQSNASNRTLEKLKRELANYNIHTGR